MAAINSPNCSGVSGLVLFSAWRSDRGGIGLLGTPFTAGSDPAVEGSRLHESGLDLFPQLGHPVLAERGVDLPQMQVGVIALSPKTELPDLKAVGRPSCFGISSTALGDEPLNQQGIAPDSSTGLGCIKETGDVSKRLRLVHAVEDSWHRF